MVKQNKKKKLSKSEMRRLTIMKGKKPKIKKVKGKSKEKTKVMPPMIQKGRTPMKANPTMPMKVL